MTKQIKDIVASKIQDAGQRIIDVVTDKLASEEITLRENMVIETMGRLKTIDKALKKINRPDLITYYGPDKVKQEAWSEGRVKDVAKHTEAIGELEKVVTKALDSNDKADYDKLKEVLGRYQTLGESSGESREKSSGAPKSNGGGESKKEE